MSVVSNQVRCLVTGEETLRFVNLCRNNGIELRHLVRRDNAIQMEIDAENFKKLRPLVVFVGDDVFCRHDLYIVSLCLAN